MSADDLDGMGTGELTHILRDDKIVFLDVDGVLNCASTTQRFNGFIGIDPLKVELLNQIVREGGARIVVSSTWRNMYELPELIEIFRDSGLDRSIEVIGKTGRSFSGHRGQEITMWIYDNGIPRRWLVLDDDSDAGEGWCEPHFVHTSWEHGLTTTDVILAGNILRD